MKCYVHTFEVFAKPGQLIHPPQDLGVGRFVTVWRLERENTAPIIVVSKNRKQTHKGPFWKSGSGIRLDFPAAVSQTFGEFFILTLYLRSSSNFSSNLRIFFLRLWIFLESCVDVSSSHSFSHEPSEELRRRLNTKYNRNVIRPLKHHPQFF